VSTLTLQWFDADDAVEVINPVIDSEHWAALNGPTTRAICAFDDNGNLAGFFCLQLHPLLGPLWVRDDERDGNLSRELATRMEEFLKGMDYRGALAICDSPVSERLCKRQGMTKLEVPVYLAKGA
jgi:hypothetical protein